MHMSAPRVVEVAARAASGVAAAMVAAASLTGFAPAASAYGACELMPGNGVEWCDIKVGKGEEVKSSDTIEMVYQVRSIIPALLPLASRTFRSAGLEEGECTPGAWPPRS